MTWYYGIYSKAPCVIYTPQLSHLGNIARHNEGFAPRGLDLFGNGL